MSVDAETCHIVVMNDEEMEVLKLMGQALWAAYEMRELPPHPTAEQTQTLLALFQRIQEM